jgi:predicted nucleotidyltransferase
VELRQVLSFRDPSITIDLDHGGVTSMYVYGSTMRGRATFDIVGLRR